MSFKNDRICLVLFLFHKAFNAPYNNLKKCLVNISDNHYEIIGTLPGIYDFSRSEKNRIIFYHKKTNNFISRIFNYSLLNVRISIEIIKNSKNVDIFFFFTQIGLHLPMLIAFFFQKKIVWMIPSSLKKMYYYDQDFLTNLIIFAQSFCYLLSNKIILYSPNLIKEWKLQNYSDKILIARHHFINFNTFIATIPLFDRPLLVGYIGRMTEEKGVQNFVRALPAILNDRKDISVLIGGDGPLKDEIVAFLLAEKLMSRVNLVGWIGHDDLPEYLNKLRLLILPSHTEGLPNILLEAMACGTPVLATAVGAIPDIMSDGETGFIMENNSPECITENVIRALSAPNLEMISHNGQVFVEKNFTFEITAKSWEKLIKNL